jgi:hypothetical protein
MAGEGRILHSDWDLYDTRHVVFHPAGMNAETLESGYWRAYRDFYRWRSIWTGASTKETLPARMRHLAYAGGWKKLEPAWDLAIRAKQVVHAAPLLEAVLTGFGSHRPQPDATLRAPSSATENHAGRTLVESAAAPAIEAGSALPGEASLYPWGGSRRAR